MPVHAQAYNTAAGLRIGRSAGLSVAQRLGRRSSAEARLTTGIWEDGTTVALLYRGHSPVLGRKLNLYVGAGAHQGFGYLRDDQADGAGRRGNPFGIDATVGAELAVRRTNIAFDYNLRLNLTGRLGQVRPPGPALTLRYVIDRRESALRLRYPWESAEEAKARRKARDKRRKARKKERRRGERRGLRDRLGLDK